MNYELYHYGVKGQKWGVRRDRSSYRPMGVRSAIAKRRNDKIDASFKSWKENSQKRATAIDLGKKSNLDRIAYEKNRSDKALKKAYKQSSKEYKKALRDNTTYRKGQVKHDVGADMARKYLTEAKRVKKQLDTDPNNKELAKQYYRLMSMHDVERERARRAPDVYANRSRRIASVKRSMTMTVKGAATAAAVAGGVAVINRYSGMEVDADTLKRAVDVGRTVLQYV